MIKISGKCTFCGACVISCPSHCILPEINEVGFLYPKIIEQNCIGCGKCETVCHLDKIITVDSNLQKAFAVRTRSDKILHNSTSGGAFTALAKYIIENNGVVYGCAYSEKLKAHHIRIQAKEEILKLNGSKYVQSDVGQSFIQVKNDLMSGRKVLFSGTPCQIAGLISFLGSSPNNLITVDIVCHGVSSQTYFDKYINWFENKYDCSLDDFNFRSKENCGWSLAGKCEGKNNSTGKPFSKKIYYYNEFYYYHFLKGFSYREACYDCKYANLNRPADISLGDLWGAYKLKLPFNIKQGCSLVLINTEKGLAFFHQIDLLKKEISLEDATRYNKQLICPSPKPIDYDEQMRFLSKTNPSDIQKIFLKKHRKDRFLGFIKYHIPNFIKNRFK